MTLFLTLGVDGRPERVLALVTETAFEVIERQSPRHYSSIPILRDVLYLKKIKKIMDQQTFHSLTHILSLHPSTHLLTHPPSHHPLTNTHPSHPPLTNTPTLHPLTYSPTNPLIHSPTHSLFHPPIHPIPIRSPTYSPIQSLTSSPTHSPTRSLTDSHSPLTHQFIQLTCDSINNLMNKSRRK